MNFNCMPDNAFLKIFQYLSLDDQVRSGRVSTAFRRISTFVVAHNKTLDLADDIFAGASAYCFSKLLSLCSANVERVVIPFEHADCRSLAAILAKECCPRLSHVTMHNAGNDALQKMLRNNPTVETLYWGPSGNFLEYLHHGPSEKLSTLDCSCNDASFRSLIGRVPNLKHLKVFAVVDSGQLVDTFFATASKLELLDMQCGRNNVDFNGMIHFWKLKSLTTLRISYEAVVACPYLPNDAVLKNIAVSFPKLTTLELLCVGVTMSGVEALARLQEIRELTLYGINAQDLDAAVERLSDCKRLKKLQLSGALVTPATLLTLLYSCSELSFLLLREIIGVDNPNTAIIMLNSCSGLHRRYVTIALCTPDQFGYAVWTAKTVQQALLKLREHGPVIKISRAS